MKLSAHLNLTAKEREIKFQIEHDGYYIDEDIFNYKDITFSAPHEYFLYKNEEPVLVQSLTNFIFVIATH